MRSLACDQVEKIYGTGCIPGRMSLLMMLLLVEQLYVSFTEIQSLYLQYKLFNFLLVKVIYYSFMEIVQLPIA